MDYPDVCIAICREALKQPDAQVSYFEHGFYDDAESISRFAIQVLGDAGGVDDLRALRNLCDNERLGLDSLNAMKKIELRTRF